MDDFVGLFTGASIIGIIIILVVLIYAIRSISIIRPYEKGVL